MIAHPYRSLDAFYAADCAPPPLARARHRPAVARRGQGAFRAAWVQETGEVYLFALGDPVDGGGPSTCSSAASACASSSSFAGFRDVCGRHGSLLWFLDRAGGGAQRRVAAVDARPAPPPGGP